MHANLEDPPLETIQDAKAYLLRTAWEQFPIQEQRNAAFPRAMMLFDDAQSLLEKPLLDINEAFGVLTSLSLEKFLLIGFAYMAGALKGDWLARDYAARGYFEGIVTPAECDAFLALTSATYEEFRLLSEPHITSDVRFKKTEFNLLVKRPLIALDEQVIAPVPRLLVQRITDGLRYDLRDLYRSNSRRNPFSEHFGRLFEQYVGIILRSAFQEEAVSPEPYYGSPEKAGPDWIVIDDNRAILFECRTSGLLLETKTTGDVLAIQADLKRILQETAAKYPGKIRDLKEGKTKVDFSRVTDILAVIVTYEPAYIEPVLRGILATSLDAEAAGYIHIDIRDLEVLSAWHKRHHMYDTIETWQRRYQESPQDFGAFANTWAKEMDFDFRSTLLDERMSAFSVQHLGRPYPTDSSLIRD
jgi:hypothetical protein